MPDRDVLIFANPIAGRGRGRPIAAHLARSLRNAGYRPIVILERPDQIRREEFDPTARAAIVIGGDGTVRGVARQLYQECADAAPARGSGATRVVGPPLLIVPMGTANLLGRHLGIQWDHRTLDDRVVDTVRQGHVVELDAACANNDLFLLMAGVGIDAHVVHELDRLRSGPITLTSYVLPAASALGLYQYPPLTVTVDGRVVFQDQPAVAFVGNIAEYGTGFPILPHARPDDGLLDVCVLPCRSRLEIVKLFLLAAGGEHLQAEGVVYTKGRDVRITSPADQPVPVQVDGEAAGHTPVDVGLLPVRVPFMVPGGQ